jgi:hypothetical protein
MEQWLGHVLSNDDGMFATQSFKKIPYRTVHQSEVNMSYKSYMSGKTQAFGEQSIIQALIDIGFEQYKYSGSRLLRITSERFNALQETYGDGIPELVPDDEDDMMA